jgi:hypothetical protein
MRPPPDSGWAVGWTFDWQPDRARGVVRSLGRAFLAWPRAGVGFWGSSRLDETAWWPAHGTAASLLLPLPVLAVALRRPFAALFYAAATLGLLAFLYVKFPGSLRHHGFFYIAAVAALWMARADRPSPPAPARGRRRWLDAAGWAVRPCLWAVLAVQAAGAWTALAADARHPFSGARETGRFLRAQGLDRLPIVAHRGPETSAVVGYAAIPRVFYAGPGRWGSFVVWDRDWDAPASFDDLIAAVARLRAGGNPRVMLLSNRQLPPRLARQRGLRPLFESAAGTVGGEQFFLYLSEGAESPREPSR